jgi:hypothetical protein
MKKNRKLTMTESIQETINIRKNEKNEKELPLDFVLDSCVIVYEQAKDEILDLFWIEYNGEKIKFIDFLEKHEKI